MIANGKDTQVTGVRVSRWWGLAVLALSLLVVGLDTTVVVTALPTLSQKLGASTSHGIVEQPARGWGDVRVVAGIRREIIATPGGRPASAEQVLRLWAG